MCVVETVIYTRRNATSQREEVFRAWIKKNFRFFIPPTRTWTASSASCNREGVSDLRPAGAAVTRRSRCVVAERTFSLRHVLSSSPHANLDLLTQDTGEQIYISSLALLKMLKHGRAGVPLEVMGLMLGEFVDDYTVKVVDVFAMPQSGTGVSVEAVDPVFQTKMLDMLKQVGRPEMVVGWYHSHPGFGCWLSGVDVNTQQSFEALNPRAVAVVIDPIQSVKGKVVIDAFRCISPQTMMLGQEPRQTTSNLGSLNKPSIQALIHGLNRHYYSMGISYRKVRLPVCLSVDIGSHRVARDRPLTDSPSPPHPTVRRSSKSGCCSTCRSTRGRRA